MELERFANRYRCECGQDWEVYCHTENEGSTCPECERMAWPYDAYDMERDLRKDGCA